MQVGKNQLKKRGARSEKKPNGIEIPHRDNPSKKKNEFPRIRKNLSLQSKKKQEGGVWKKRGDPQKCT